MTGFDPSSPPDWVKRLAERWLGAESEHFRSQSRPNGEEGGSPIVALGAGTFVAPLPVGWSLHPVRPFEGRIRVKEGYDVRYRIDSHEDAEAAAGGARLLDYAAEPELKASVQDPADVVSDILISIPGRDAEGKDIVWKCVEPFAGTHVRELLLRCPLISGELVEHRVSIGRAIGEWLQMGGFSPLPTALDRIAHTPTLERKNFDDLLLMRVPRQWQVEVDSEKEGRKNFVAQGPDERDTLWVTSSVLPMLSARFGEIYIAATASEVWGKSQRDAEPWSDMRKETLPDGDLLMTMSRTESEGARKLRRIRWYRYALREEDFFWSEIDLVTYAEFVDDEAQVAIAALMDREVRGAMLSGRPPQFGTAPQGPSGPQNGLNSAG